MADDTKKLDFAQSLNRLEEINTWFQTEDINLDEGLQKLREGNELIKQCREKLQAVENEFVKIKQEYADDSEQAVPLADGQAPNHHVREVGVVDTEDVPADDIPF
jgi:exodeoxyribonuclease VII small subunit